ncbi:MAG: TonB-dependent receptor plug domain-containing protein [Saprospiraceae bacterium]
MKNNLRFFLSGILAAALLVPVSSTAQSVLNALDSLDLPEAIVVANRAPVDRQSVGHTLDIITKAQLESLPISNIAEALQYVGGLDVRQRGPRGVQADLSIRGGTFDQVLILVNGIRLSDPQTGHHALNIPVPLEHVERIEVLKGPGARLYGQNAFAGAINIVTSPGKEQAIGLRGELGENGLGGFGVSINLPKAGANHLLSYQRDFAQGYRYNTDYTIQNIMYQSEMTIGENKFSALAALSDRAFGANGFYASASATDQFEAIQTSVIGLQHTKRNDKGSFSQRISWRRNQDEYIFIRSNPSIYRNLHISHTYGYDAYKSINNKFGSLGLGGELQNVALTSNNLGDHQRIVANALVEQRFELLDADLTVTPSVSFNYLSDVGAQVLPGLDVSYDVSDDINFYGNAGMTSRVPTYTDLYYSDRYNQGNADLSIERAYAFELGANYEKNGWEAKAAVWTREAIDLIDYVRESAADTVWQPQNITDATFSGVELQLSARNRWKWLPLAQVSYNYIDAELADDPESQRISRYALDQLTHQFNATAIIRITNPLSATLALRVADRVSEPGLGDLPVDYELLDLRFDYRLKKAKIFAEATNLLDQEYTQANGVPLPGRWMRTGVAFRL